jgi:hypothetical protein
VYVPASGGEGGGEGEGEGRDGRREVSSSARTLLCPRGRMCASARTGSRPRGRWGASARREPAFVRTRFLPRPRVKLRPRVNADAGGRLDEKDVRTDIFIQKRPL